MSKWIRRRKTLHLVMPPGRNRSRKASVEAVPPRLFDFAASAAYLSSEPVVTADSLQ